MRRPYTLDHYRRLVDGIVERLPHASIGSDVIVGFPGETDDDFEVNAAYLRAVSAFTSARVSLFGSSGHGGDGDEREGPRTGDPRTWFPDARDRRGTGGAFSGFAACYRAAGADAGGRHAGCHR